MSSIFKYKFYLARNNLKSSASSSYTFREYDLGTNPLGPFGSQKNTENKPNANIFRDLFMLSLAFKTFS